MALVSYYYLLYGPTTTELISHNHTTVCIDQGVPGIERSKFKLQANN